MSLYGGVEAGGTKFVCMIASGPDDIRAETRFPTTTPVETLGRVVEFFRQHSAESALSGIGFASFGPVDLDLQSPTYGYMTSTPKPGWAQTDIVGALRIALQLPIAFDTDVNAAAYGEYRWGAAVGLDSVIYITVGTGIGGGVVSRGTPIHGLVHPEIGHMLVPHDVMLDPFPGYCSYHRDCWEGLASGPAIKLRWGQPAETLPPGHPAWELEAHYLALAVANLVLIHSPRRIVLGGGVMQQPGLIEMVRARTVAALNGYIRSPEILERIDRYLVLPGLGNRAGVLGAIALAMEKAARSSL